MAGVGEGAAKPGPEEPGPLLILAEAPSLHSTQGYLGPSDSPHVGKEYTMAASTA